MNSPDLAATAAIPAARPRKRSTRTLTVVWLRKFHGWIGLWGGVLGLVFGFSGIWLNHRAVLQLPPVAQLRTNSQLALPDPPPADAKALAAWAQEALQLDRPANNIRVEPAKPLPWLERGSRRERGGEGREGREGASEGEGRGAQAGAAASAPMGAASGARLMQPEHWMIGFGGPHDTIQVEAWAGNRSVSVRRVDNGLVGTLMNMHKGIGMPVAWILLVDTLAGSLIVLSLTGFALWFLTNRRKVVGVVITGAVLAAAIGLTVSRL